MGLLEKLAGAPYIDQLEALGLTRFVDKLRTSQADFDRLFATRSQEELVKVTYDVKVFRKATFETYQDLADDTAVLAQVKGDNTYLDLLEVLNNSRCYYADFLARR